MAALVAALLVMLTACQSTAGGSSGAAPGGGATSAPKSASIAGSDTKLCGTPPCMRYVSRSETRTVHSTITDHPLVSAVALHLVGTVLCGGILCLLGEGLSLTYVDHEAGIAVAANECLRVNILPSGKEWQLVSLTPSDDSPYCTD